jgi:hypothetical protein
MPMVTGTSVFLLLQSALQPLVGFRPAQLSLSILSRKVLQSAVASGTSNPQIGGTSVFTIHNLNQTKNYTICRENPSSLYVEVLI